MTYTKGWTERVTRGRVDYIVPWHPQRVRWVKCRNLIIDALRLFGVRIESRLSLANKIMGWRIVALAVPRWPHLYDRKSIKKIEGYRFTDLIRDNFKTGA